MKNDEIKMNKYGTIATVNGVDYKVTKIHGFDDFGHTLDTATLEGYGEIYSDDEGATWWTDNPFTTA